MTGLRSKVLFERKLFHTAFRLYTCTLLWVSHYTIFDGSKDSTTIVFGIAVTWDIVLVRYTYTICLITGGYSKFGVTRHFTAK